MVAELRLMHFLVMLSVETKHLVQSRTLIEFCPERCTYVHYRAYLQSTLMCFVPRSSLEDRWQWRAQTE